MNKRYITSLVALTLCILSVGTVYFFAFKHIWEKAAQIALYKNDIMFADQKKQYAETMLASFENSESDVSNLQDFFVKKQGEVEFIEFIEQTAKAQGLEIEIDTISLDTPKEMSSKGVQYLLLRFHVKGEWAGVWGFSRTLEVLPYSIDINSIALLREDQNQVAAKNKPIMWKGVYVVKVLKKK